MVHGFILTFAFSSLPRRLALVVAGYAIAGFFIMIAAQTFRAPGPPFQRALGNDVDGWRALVACAIDRRSPDL